MKILILGYSDLVQRKIIPAIKKFKNIKFDVASLSKMKIKQDMINGIQIIHQLLINLMQK